MTGTREQPTIPGTKKLDVPYPRIEEIQDGSMEDGSKVGIISAGTAGCMELYKHILLKDVPQEKYQRYAKYLDEYYRMRLWYETGIDKVPVMVGDDDLALQGTQTQIANVSD